MCPFDRLFTLLKKIINDHAFKSLIVKMAYCFKVVAEAYVGDSTHRLKLLSLC